MTIVEEGVSSVYAAPGRRGALAEYRNRYGHYIGGEFVDPVKGQYFENISPVNGKPFCEVGRGTAEDIDRAVDVAWKAFASWKKTTPAERANILNKIADRIEQNLESIAVAETWDNGKPVRIGVNGGSLNQELVMRKMQENTDKNLGKDSEQIINECMVLSALESTELALESGLRPDQIIISCKTSRPRDLITVYRDLSSKTQQPLHLGLTEAGMGMKGQIWSAASLGVLLYEGIGDTIRISLTPRPGGDRREEVYAACEVLQALGLRSFAPSVTACPGCGRTTSTTFQELAEAIQGYIRDQMPVWKTQYEGVENMTLAVMGCIVNEPGQSKAANIGISLPGSGEAPRCPVYIDGERKVTLEGTYDELAAAFQELVQNYISSKYPRKTAAVPAGK